MCKHLCFLIALSLFAVTATATVTITPTGGGSVDVIQNEIVEIEGVSEREIVVVCTGNPGMGLSVVATAGVERIRHIKIASVAWSATQGNVDVVVFESGGTIQHIRNIYSVSLEPFEDDGEVAIADVIISGSLGDPGVPHGGLIAADVVSQLHPQGDITADVVSGPRVFGAPSIIATISSSSGSIFGHVFAPTGAIDSIAADADIGSSGDPVVIAAHTSIKVVEADSIWAGIDTTLEGGYEDIWYVKARSGSFSGYLNCRDLSSPTTPSGIDIAGDLNADVFTRVLREPIIADSLGGDNTVWIGSSMVDDGDTSDGRIVLGAGGLAGQIILNGAAATPSGAWSGDVTVGSIVLNTSQSQPNQAPYYNRLSSTLGGGSVGLAAFNLHGTDCLPANNATAQGLLSSVRVRHYGPIALAASEPVLLERQAQTNPPSSWVGVTSNFTYSVSNGRDLIITPKTGQAFTAPAIYRVSHTDATTRFIECDEVTGNPLVMEYSYEFTLQPELYDFSRSGGFGPEDLVQWLFEPVDITFDDSADDIDWDILVQALEDTER